MARGARAKSPGRRPGRARAGDLEVCGVPANAHSAMCCAARHEAVSPGDSDAACMPANAHTGR